LGGSPADTYKIRSQAKKILHSTQALKWTRVSGNVLIRSSTSLSCFERLEPVWCQLTPSVAEKEYLLEYYSLVREGKTAYCSFLPYMQVFGDKPQEMPDFFKAYAVSPFTRGCVPDPSSSSGGSFETRSQSWQSEFKPKRRKIDSE
jgi:hypothetical protein